MQKSLGVKDIEDIINPFEINLVTSENKPKLYFIYRMNKQNPYINYLIHYNTGISGETTIGHWVALVIDNINKTANFFDSYGRFPDDSLNLISKEYRKKTKQNQRDIGEFMYTLLDEGYELRYNDKQYQKISNNINTCGRWVATFIVFINQGGKEENFEKFINKLKKIFSIKNNDELIVKLTE